MTLKNGEKVFTNPYLVERKYYRVTNNMTEMSSDATDLSLDHSELDPLNKQK